MCLIQLKREQEEELVVPSRRTPTAIRGTAATGNRTPIPRTSQPRISMSQSQTSHHRPRSQTRERLSDQLVIVDQRTPRVSATSIRHGRDGPVVIQEIMPHDPQRPVLHRELSSRRGSRQYGTNPRMSNASYRSTRERIMVVDSNGVRRQYYR